MADLQKVEVLGGPLDGMEILWDADSPGILITDGLRLYRYEIGEQWTGEQMRLVMRHTNTIPMPQRKS
jgi:hypothetical protein